MAPSSYNTRIPFADIKNIKQKESDFSSDISEYIKLLKSSSNNDTSQASPILISLSVQFRKDGQLLSLGLASTETILIILNDVINKAAKWSLTMENIHSSIVSLFEDEEIRFVGFHFHRIAAMLKAQLGVDVKGYDVISTLSRTGPVPTPGQIVFRFLGPKEFPQFEVDRLWDDVVEELTYITRSGVENLMDRAWITAK